MVKMQLELYKAAATNKTKLPFHFQPTAKFHLTHPILQPLTMRYWMLQALMVWTTSTQRCKRQEAFIHNKWDNHTSQILWTLASTLRTLRTARIISLEVTTNNNPELETYTPVMQTTEGTWLPLVTDQHHTKVHSTTTSPTIKPSTLHRSRPVILEYTGMMQVCRYWSQSEI